MKASDFSDAEIDECSKAAYALRTGNIPMDSALLDLWRPHSRDAIDGVGLYYLIKPSECAAVIVKAAAIVKDREAKESQYLGKIVSAEGGSGSGGGFAVVALNYREGDLVYHHTAPAKLDRINVTINVTAPKPPAIDGLLTPDVLRYQPIALQRCIVDTMQAGREVSSALLWRMDLSREPAAAALRAEIVAGRMRARGWKAARE